MSKALDKAKKYINTHINRITILDVYPSINIKTLGKTSATYRCDCGRIVENKILARILNGDTKQCKICATTANSNCENKKNAVRNNAKYDYLVGQTINWFTVLRWVTKEDTKYTGRFVCRCVCGEIRYISGHELTESKDRKSCGCMASYSQSLTNGGTGIPYETATINSFIRQIPEYTRWVTECLNRANFTCNITKQRGCSLNVHHINSLAGLISLYGITKDNYTDYLGVLFDLNNGIVLTETLHKQFHLKYGRNATIKDLLEFKNNYLKSIT